MQQQKLPNISGGDRGPNLSDSIDKENPFEYTWGILRALKSEVRELQAAVRAEQHMREEEVGQLQRELKDLREQLTQEKAERKSELQRAIDPCNGHLEELKLDMRNMKATREQQVHSLTEALADEKKERNTDVRDLSDRLQMEEKTRTQITTALSDNLGDTKRLLDATGSDARLCIRNLTQDVRLIADQLTRVNHTWKAFNTSDLVSVQAQPLSPKPPTSHPPPNGSRPAGPFAS